MCIFPQPTANIHIHIAHSTVTRDSIDGGRPAIIFHTTYYLLTLRQRKGLGRISYSKPKIPSEKGVPLPPPSIIAPAWP